MHVGITGRKRSGKNTIAEVFEAEGFVPLAFAEPLKAMLRAVYEYVGVDEATIHEKIEGELKEVPCPILQGKTPRHAMQTIGTEWGRDQIGEDFWVDIWERKAVRFDSTVTTDVRFLNEADRLTKFDDGYLIRVERPGLNSTDLHPSEREIDLLPAQSIVKNNGSIEDLHNKGKAIVDYLC